MVWFKVDDKLWGHPKWLALPPRARGLWVTAGSWCAAMGTDGFVPRHVVGALSGRRDDAVHLTQTGLWVEVDGGWTFHDWAEFQPDSASERSRRVAESKGGDLGNHRRWHEQRGLVVPSCEFCDASAPDRVPDRGADSPPNPPVPARPDPKSNMRIDSVERDQPPTPTLDTDFAKWWSAYPRKRGKGQALKAYRTARKHTTAEQLLTALHQQRPALTAKGPEYCPYPATWLNGQRWEDDLTEPAPRPSEISPWDRTYKRGPQDD